MINESDPKLIRHIMENVLPPKGTVLYKFRTIKGSGLEKILRNHTLWFGSPLTWNDPFDGQIRPVAGYTEGNFASWLKKSAPGMPKDRVDILVQHNRENPGKWEVLRDEALTDGMRGVGMCCFSNTWDPMLQWSYYADGHTGVALGFHRDLDLKLFGMAHRVEYVEDYPEINYFTEAARVIEAVLHVKSDVWSHEREVRIWNNPPGLKKYDPEALREIIFGVRCDPRQIAKIQKWCRSSGLAHVEFYQAELAPRSFEVTRKRI